MNHLRASRKAGPRLPMSGRQLAVVARLRQSMLLASCPLFLCHVLLVEHARRSKMTISSTIRSLTVKLRIARLRVRRLEMLLLLAEREAASRCEHDWEKVYPSGPRDNGEFGYVCKICGKTE